MDTKELRKERVSLFRDSASFRRTARIPHFANVVTWKVFDAGHTLEEALADLSVMRECIVHFLESYPVDGMLDAFTVGRPSVTAAPDDPGLTDDIFDCLMEREGSFPEKAFPGECRAGRVGGIYSPGRSPGEYLKYFMFTVSLSRLVSGEYGIPPAAPGDPLTGTFSFAAEALAENPSGLKALSAAMRRDEGRLRAFTEEWNEKRIAPLAGKILVGRGPNMKYCFDASFAMTAHNIMNVRQFDMFYWPGLSEYLQACETKGLNIRIFTEGSISRFTDHFADIKKGTVVLHPENDDVFFIRDRLPDTAIMGGLTPEVLRADHISDAVDHTRMLCERLGRDGGFILSEGKMLSRSSDAYGANYRAICGFMNGRAV